MTPVNERLRLGKMTNPVRGFLHGGAAAASMVGLVVLILQTHADVPKMLSMLVFGLSLLALYATSTIYHSIPWRPAWKARLQRLDHSMILVLVAGTYTPVAFNVLPGSWRVVTLSVVWSLAAIGILQKVAFPRVRTWFILTLALVMGWFALVPFLEIARRLALPALGLIALGGICYTIGAVFYAAKWPRLFPSVFSHHELFHVLVVVGSFMHFVAILVYVVPVVRL